MNKHIFYQTYDGKIIEREDIEDAFYIATGKHAETHEGEFIRFLNDCFGKSVESYAHYTPDDLIKKGYNVMAMRLYREENKCTLKEAVEEVRKHSENFQKKC